DTSTCQPVILLNAHTAEVTALAFSSTGEFLATADTTGTIILWKFAGHKPLYILKGDGGEIHHLAFNSEGRQLAACGSGRVIELWDVRSGEVLFGADVPSGSTTRIALSPDGARVVCTGQRDLRIWNTQNGQDHGAENVADVRLAVPSIVTSVAYSPDG